LQDGARTVDGGWSSVGRALTVSSRTILAAAVAAVVLPLALWSFLPGKTQAQSATKLQNQLNGSQNNEKRLSASAATFAKLVRDIESVLVFEMNASSGN